MQHKNWSCPKCDHKEYEVGEIRVAGSFWSKIFNVQNVPIQNFTRDSHLHDLQMYLISLPLNNY